jgi:TonB-linked SusC/RagA family outer membrane protein
MILLFALVQLQATPARTQQRVTLALDRVTVEELVKEVERQSGHVVIYNNDQLRSLPRLTVHLAGATAVEALNHALRGSGFTCQRVEEFLVISRVAPAAPQPRRVEGKIVDKSARPVPGATVWIKGTSSGTSSGRDGSFTLVIPPDGQVTLVISFIGMKTVEVNGEAPGPLLVVMEEEIREMDEIIVTGIFSKTRESYTGAATTITAAELKSFGNRSILATIRNIDPSFNIMENIEYGSDPNHLPEITLRGRANMDANVRALQDDSQARRASNCPLFIVDGFEASLQRVMDMDDQQVASVTILKDASATALYGSRGANGIIVITTRQPVAGTIRFTYKANLNVEAPDFSSYNLMNAREKLAYERAAGIYDNPNPAIAQEYAELYNRRLVEIERGVDTYWLKYPVHAGTGQRHSLRAEGGDDNFRYAASIGYNNISGIMKQSYRNTLTGGLLFQYNLKTVKFANNLTLNFNKSSNSPYGNFSDYTVLNPYETPYNEDGSLKKMLVNLSTSDRTIRASNPLYNATLPARNTAGYTEIQDNLSVEWNLAPGLLARGRVAVTKRAGRSDLYLSNNNTLFEPLVGEEFGRRGSYDFTYDEALSWEGDFTLNYNKLFRERHLLYAGLNYSLAESRQEQLAIAAEGFAAANMGHLGMASAYALGGKPSGSEEHARRLGGILNLNYTYDHRYFVDLSGKLEGSSKFGSNDRAAPFWSAGIGWNAHHEKFLRDSDRIDYLRFRLSYGTTGSQDYDPYQALMTFRFFSAENYRYWQGASLIGIGNPDLTWQKTRQVNAGMEIALENNRARLSVDLYDKLTVATLTDINLPTATGFNSYKANAGEVRNRGIEVSAHVLLVDNRTRDLLWSVSGSLAHNRNKILKISNSLEFLNKLLIEQSGSNPSFLYKEGESMNTLYAVRSLGIDPANGNELFLTRDGSKSYTWNAADKVACGVNEPAAWGTFSSKLRYRGLSLNVVFGYRAGGYSYNQTLIDKVENHDPWLNGDRRVLYDRWKTPGDHTYFKSVKNTSATRASSRFVMKENTLECRTINLDYEFNPRWLRGHLPVEYLSVGAYAEDIFRASTIRQERGLYYPFARKFSLSLSARF